VDDRVRVHLSLAPLCSIRVRGEVGGAAPRLGNRPEGFSRATIPVSRSIFQLLENGAVDLYELVDTFLFDRLPHHSHPFWNYLRWSFDCGFRWLRE
jgi:hypothetical protein